MKSILSQPERTFILTSLDSNLRIDGRELLHRRPVRLTLGEDYGTAMVSLGDTKVLSRTTVKLSSPLPSRPQEGRLCFSVNLDAVQGSRELSAEITRLLERTYRSSNVLDLESLCLRAGERVWEIRVDVSALNDDGNLLDTASVAVLVSLAHCRVPATTVIGTEITVHSEYDREPSPLTVYHFPLSVTFAFFHGSAFVVDPNSEEELASESKLSVSVNRHREVCSLHMSGGVVITTDDIRRCCELAAGKVRPLTDMITEALEKDRVARGKGVTVGFVESFDSRENPLASSAQVTRVGVPHPKLTTADVDPVTTDADLDSDMFSDDVESDGDVDTPSDKGFNHQGNGFIQQSPPVDNGTSRLANKGCNIWQLTDGIVRTNNGKRRSDIPTDRLLSDSGSEEEVVDTLIETVDGTYSKLDRGKSVGGIFSVKKVA